MLVFAGILAASIDALVCGTALAASGIKSGLKDVFKTTGVIFACCIMASNSVRLPALAQIGKAIELSGTLMMFILSYVAFDSVKEEKTIRSTDAVAFSVAADAAIVCINLAAEGYSPLTVSLASAASHSLLMLAGNRLTILIINEKILQYTGYFSSIVFFIMAVTRLARL